METEIDNDWHSLGSLLYRKWQAYSYSNSSDGSKNSIPSIIHPNLKLEEYIICGAPYGGPIALIALPATIPTSPTVSPSKAVHRLLISSAAGKQLADVPFLPGPRNMVVGLGWTDQEHLIVVLSDGAFLKLSIARS